MECDFESLERCVSVCNVPNSFSKDDVVSVVNVHLLDIDGHVISIEPVLGVDEKNGLHRWIILLNSVNCVSILVSVVRSKEIIIANKSFTIEYRSSTSCEVPEHWRELTPKLGCHRPSSPDGPSFHGPSSPIGPRFHRPFSDGFSLHGPASAPDRQSFHGHTSPDRPGPISEACQDYHEPGTDVSHTGPGHMPESYQHFPKHIPYPRARFYPYPGVDPGQFNFHSMFMSQLPTNPGYIYPHNYLPDIDAHAQPNPTHAEPSSCAACDTSGSPPNVQYPAQGNEAFHKSDPTNDINLLNQMTHLHIQDRYEDSLKADEDGNHATIVVSKIPEVWLDEERIKMIFESRKCGGFEVAGVTIIDRDKAKAIVEFVDAKACEKVLQKRPINVSGNELHVEIYIPEQEECYECDNDKSDENKNSRKIIVSNLPSSAHDNYLEIFFESRKLGGWSVVDVEMIEDEAVAIVEFEDSEAVCDIMKRRPILMMDKTIDMEIYQPQPVSLRTIEVRGPPNVVTKDQLYLLELYFENTKRSGGSDIVDSHCDDEQKVVYITYQSEEVAQRVVEKSPHILRTGKLTVQLHVPNRKLPVRNSAKNTSKEDKDEESSAPLCTVMVKGYPKSKAHSTLEFYFDNKRRSGGGGVVAIQSDNNDENVLFVTFENEEVAKEVASRSHRVEGYDLAVILHIPPKPKPCYEDRVLIKNIHSTTTKDGLFNFLEAKTGCIPKTLTYHAKDEGVAMVSFENLDFGKMEENLNKFKLEGANLQISRILISNCILVSNLASDVTRDVVQYYFENTRKSGGGQVDKVVMQLDQRSCLVFFEDFHVIDKVLNREHTLSEQKLDVHRYQDCLGQQEEDT